MLSLYCPGADADDPQAGDNRHVKGNAVSVVTLVAHKEMAITHEVWWAESADVPDLAVCADSFSELMEQVRSALKFMEIDGDPVWIVKARHLDLNMTMVPGAAVAGETEGGLPVFTTTFGSMSASGTTWGPIPTRSGAARELADA